MESNYRKIPGRNWQVTTIGLDRKSFEKLQAWVETQHNDPAAFAYAVSQRAGPIISTNFFTDEGHVTIEFRGRHEEHQDYVQELKMFLREISNDPSYEIERF